MVNQWHFFNCRSYFSLLYKRHGYDILLVLIYVDDILITGSNSSLVLQVISNMQHAFALTGLEDLNYFMGIQVSKTTQKSTFVTSQVHCILVSEA